MSELERRVRDSLRDHVDRTPMGMAPADPTVAWPASRRRRGTMITVAVLVVMVALAVGGFALLNQPPPPAVTAPGPAAIASGPAATASAPAATSWPRPDLLIDPATDRGGWRTLLTASGQRIPLNQAVDTAYQIPGGWLVSDRIAGEVWLVRADGSAHVLLDGVDGYAVAPDGQRIAWRADNRLYVGHLAGAVLVPDRSTPAPARGVPLAYTGAAVVLGYSMTGGGIDQHDVWLPANGDYSPTWDAAPFVVAVYQPAPDGSLLGVVRPSAGSKEACLARLDPRPGLRATRTACGLPITIDPDGLVSPDGRWLATTSLSPAGQPDTSLIDLDAVFGDPAVVQTWAAVGPPAWVDASTVVLTSADTSLMLARVGQADLVPLAGPGVPAGRKLFPVPRLGGQQ